MMLSSLNRLLTRQPNGASMSFATATLRRWGPLVLILGLALAIRVAYLPAVGFRSDIRDLGIFMDMMHSSGLLKFYNYSELRVYPPITTALFALIAELHV